MFALRFRPLLLAWKIRRPWYPGLPWPIKKQDPGRTNLRPGNPVLTCWPHFRPLLREKKSLKYGQIEKEVAKTTKMQMKTAAAICLGLFQHKFILLCQSLSLFLYRVSVHWGKQGRENSPIHFRHFYPPCFWLIRPGYSSFNGNSPAPQPWLKYW